MFTKIHTRWNTAMASGNLPDFAHVGVAEFNILFIRKDWLDRAGIPVPVTFEDVIETARAFNRIMPGGPNTILKFIQYVQ